MSGCPHFLQIAASISKEETASGEARIRSRVTGTFSGLWGSLREHRYADANT